MKKRVVAAILAPSILGLTLAAVAQAHQPSTKRPADVRNQQAAESIWGEIDGQRGKGAKREGSNDDWRKKFWEEQGSSRSGGS